MKLLFVIGDISASGGTERVTAEIVSALSDLGHDVTILSLFGPAHPWFSLPVSVEVKGAGLLEASGSLRRFFTISRSLKREVNSFSYDAVILVDTILFAFCMPWVFFSKSKIICWEHFNLENNNGTKMRDFSRFAASLFSNKVIVLTESDAKAWRLKYRVKNRIRKIWNPAPFFPEANQFENKDDDSNVVLAVGRLTEVKGFHVLLQAWWLLGDVRKGWTLRIVGDGEEISSLSAQAESLGLSQSVVFVGRLRDLSLEYGAADIYVLSSFHEGLPMSLLEAQQFGLPSVSTNCVTGPSEILNVGNGILVEVGNPKALSAGLSQLMNDPILRADYGEAARMHSRRFKVSEIIKVWEELLLEL